MGGRWPSGRFDLTEEIFRAETLAQVGNLSQATLAGGLSQLLSGPAATWYWVYRRREPNATWAQLSAAFVFQFQTHESDASIRRKISDRLQNPGEKFMEFSLAVQALNLRLTNRMGDDELLEILRRNMIPAYQDRLIFFPIANIFELQQRCQQLESMWESQAEVRGSRARVAPRISELECRQHCAPIQILGSEQAAEARDVPEPDRQFRAIEIAPQPGPRDANPFSQDVPHGENPIDEQQQWVCAVDYQHRQNEYII